MTVNRSVLQWTVALATAWSAAAIGMLLSRGSQPDYYKSLKRPSWSPPAGVFAPVWSVLYMMMGTAALLLWRNRRRPGARAALGLYAGQLALNAAWSPIFFRLRKPRLALYALGALWATLLGLTAVSWRVHRQAAALLLPYLAWTTFAGALNRKIVQMNPPRTRPHLAERFRQIIQPQ